MTRFVEHQRSHSLDIGLHSKSSFYEGAFECRVTQEEVASAAQRYEVLQGVRLIVLHNAESTPVFTK